MSDTLESIAKLAQKCIEQVPVIVLGSGASAQHGVRGMGPLRDFILKDVQPLDSEESLTWDHFRTELEASGDLELALHRVQLPAELERRVVKSTRKMILDDDLKVFNELVAGATWLPLSDLLRHLLRSTRPSVTIVTTNYDRLAEYASDCAGIRVNTGFSDGYLRSFESPPTIDNHRSRTVDIWKVHGSVDWFISQHDIVMALPDVAVRPDSLSPLLVTPGTGKYLVTHEEPFRSIIARSDNAFASARSIICVGYGFNDRHIQPKLRTRVMKEQVPVVVLARALTDSAKGFISECKTPSFLALEKSDLGTRAYCAEHLCGVDLPGDLWTLGGFLTAITR